MKTCETCKHWSRELHNQDFGECEITGPEWRMSHPDAPILTQDREGADPVLTHKAFGCNQHEAKIQTRCAEAPSDQDIGMEGPSKPMQGYIPGHWEMP